MHNHVDLFNKPNDQFISVNKREYECLLNDLSATLDRLEGFSEDMDPGELQELIIIGHALNRRRAELAQASVSTVDAHLEAIAATTTKLTQDVAALKQVVENGVTFAAQEADHHASK